MDSSINFNPNITIQTAQPQKKTVSRAKNNEYDSFTLSADYRKLKVKDGHREKFLNGVKKFLASGCTAPDTKEAGVFLTEDFLKAASRASRYNLNKKMSIKHNPLHGEIDYEAQALRYLEGYNLNNPNKQISGKEAENITAKLTEASKQAQKLEIHYDRNLNETAGQIDAVFQDRKTIDKLSARAKSQSSISAKLSRKVISEGLDTSSYENCFKAIGDAVGARIQIKSLSKDESKEIVESILSANNIDASADDFARFLMDDETLDSETVDKLSSVSGEILDELKTRQTQSVVNQLILGIREGKIPVFEINNYGDEITSYFTNKQIHSIVDAYDYAKAKGLISNENGLRIVNKDALESDNVDISLDEDKSSDHETSTSSAMKDSGYSSSQMNIKHTLKDGSTIYSELQIRGSRLNAFADIEHIVYDIKTGKIHPFDPKYKTIYDAIKRMDKDTYKQYNEFLKSTYKNLRMKELGLLEDDGVLPDIKDYIGYAVSDDDMRILDVEGLISLS